MNAMAVEMLHRTPPWVFLLVAFLVWRAIGQLRRRVVPYRRVAIVPGIFIVMGIVGLFNAPGSLAARLAYWGAGLFLFAPLGLATHIDMQADRRRHLVELEGSLLPMIRVLIVFGAHYALQASAFIYPPHRIEYWLWDGFVSGASTGYFGGWILSLVRNYATAAPADLHPEREPA